MEHAPAGRVSAIASQEAGALERFGISEAEAEASLWTIEPGRRLAGAAAVARVAQAMGRRWEPLGRLWLLPGGAAAYRWVAGRRSFFSRIWSDLPPFP